MKRIQQELTQEGKEHQLLQDTSMQQSRQNLLNLYDAIDELYAPLLRTTKLTNKALHDPRTRGERIGEEYLATVEQLGKIFYENKDGTKGTLHKPLSVIVNMKNKLAEKYNKEELLTMLHMHH
ncbi:MAG: hypothetical protein LBG52_03595 [Candidatus Peribacteria bacterium]|nr:hypothetical protein [Candidatus Peribacteria bacterium]